MSPITATIFGWLLIGLAISLETISGGIAWIGLGFLTLGVVSMIVAPEKENM